MPQPLKIESVKQRIPVRYRIHILIRGMMILFASAVVIYSIFFLINFVTSETPLFYKIVPLLICFFGVDSLFRHLFGLNSITFFPERMDLGFLGKPAIKIPYTELISMELQKQITYYLHFSYRDKKGNEQKFRVKGSFPRVLEIILGMYEMAPQLQLTDKMKQTCQYLEESAREGEQSNV